MSTTLPLYWNLSLPSADERLNASTRLIDALQRFQAQHKELASTSGDQEPESQSQFEKANAPDVRYAVQRLIRGLSSSRQSSRLGFAVALTELLTRFNTVACSHVIDLVMQMSEAQGSMSGQEERDVLFGRLFGLTAVVESGLLFRSDVPEVGPSSVPALSTLDDYKGLLVNLFELAEKKSWLRESCWWTVLRAVEALYGSSVQWKSRAIKWTISSVFEENSSWSPEKLALGLRMQRLQADLKGGSLLAPTFKDSNLLSAGNLSTLAKVLKDLPVDEETGSSAGHGSWKPQLHFVWDLILDSYLNLESSTESPLSPKSEFSDFFRIVVDESLFAASSSHERKSWGFQVFVKALPRLPGSQIPMVFTPNFMRTWINHLSVEDRFLHKAALSLVKIIQEVVLANPSAGFSLVSQLMGKHGNQQFDRITKTKMVETLIASMDTNGVRQFVEFLIHEASKSMLDGAAVDIKRAWALDQLHSLLRNGSIPKHQDWINLVLQFFVLHGFFNVRKKNSKSAFACLREMSDPPFSGTLQQKCREKLYASLAVLIHVESHNKDKMQQNDTIIESNKLWFSRVIAYVQDIAKDKKHVGFLYEQRDDIVSARVNAFDVRRKVQEMSPTKGDAVNGVTLLLDFMVLQSFAQTSDDIGGLKECTHAIADLFHIEGPVDEGMDGSEEAAPIDLIVDLLIGFLETSTAHARDIAGQIFKCLTKEVLPSTIDLILAQLQNKGIDDESISEQDKELDPTGPSDAEDGDDTGESDDGSLSGNEDGDVDPAVRAAIAKILRENGAASESEDEDEHDQGASAEEEPSEDDILDDDMMLRLDNQLVDILRPHVNAKKSRKDAQREAVHFRIRVTDLLDIYMKEQPDSPYLMQAIAPLVDIAVFSDSDEQQLSSKVSTLLSTRIVGAKQFPTSFDRERGAQILRELHEKAQKAGPSQLIDGCVTYMCRLLLQNSSGIDAAMVEIYQTSLENFITRKSSRLTLKFFQGFFSRFSACAWELRQRLVQLCSSSQSTNAYRQGQAFQLVASLLSQLPVMMKGTPSPIPPADLTRFFYSVRQACFDAIAGFCDRGEFPSSHLRDILKVLQQAIRLSLRLLPPVPDLQAIWLPKDFSGLYARLQGHAQFKSSPSVGQVCRQITELLSEGGPQTKKAKLNGCGPEVHPQGDPIDNERPKPVKKPKKSKRTVEEDGVEEPIKKKRKRHVEQ